MLLPTCLRYNYQCSWPPVPTLLARSVTNYKHRTNLTSRVFRGGWFLCISILGCLHWAEKRSTTRLVFGGPYPLLSSALRVCCSLGGEALEHKYIYRGCKQTRSQRKFSGKTCPKARIAKTRPLTRGTPPVFSVF